MVEVCGRGPEQFGRFFPARGLIVKRASHYGHRIHGAGIYANIFMGLILMVSMEHHFSSSTVRIRHGYGHTMVMI